jgi:hypothetical protein
MPLHADQPEPAAAVAMSVHLDGSPRLLRDGQELNAGTRKALALALLIVLEPGLRRARAADLLWPDTDPTDARRNLRRDLFRLRQLGLPIAEGAGERLQLQAEAKLAIVWPRPGATAPRWLESLDDTAGAELAQWAAEQAPLLHQRWLQALEQEARAYESAGHLAEATRAWRALLADGAAGPGHEAARQALQRLHERHESPAEVAAGPGAVDSVFAPLAPPGLLPVSASGPMPASRTMLKAPPFVGRVDELAAVRVALAAGQRVLIAGAPGIGKTRLALEALAPFDGVLVLRCRPEDSAVPYAGALRALHALRDAAPDVPLPARLLRDLAALVPQWLPRGSAGSASPAEPVAMPSPERLHHAYQGALALLAAGNFGALLIDDWQWADEPSQALWEPVASTRDHVAADLPCVLAHRSGELTMPALQRRRQWLDQGRVTAVNLGPLPEADARALLAAVADGDAGLVATTDSALATVLERSAGHPLFLIEHLRHAREHGAALVPASVQEVLVARSRALGPVVRRVLEAACLAGDALSAPLLARALSLDELAVSQALEHALAADLLAADRHGPLRIAHDLIAQAIASSLAPLRRAALHAALAQALAGQPGTEPAEVARHLGAAGRPAEAATWRLRAADVALQRHAWPEACSAAEAALAASRDPQERLAALRTVAQAQKQMANIGAAEAALHSAIAEAHRIGPTALIDLALARAYLLSEVGRAEEALTELRQLEADPALTDPQRARLWLERANAESYHGRHDAALPALREALARTAASALRDRWDIGSMLSRTLYWSGRLDDALAQVESGLQLARAMGDSLRTARSLHHLGLLQRSLGQVDASAANLLDSIAIARQLGLVELLRSALSTLATVHLDRLELDAAEALIVEGEQAAPTWDSVDMEDVFDERRYRLHQLRGEVEAAWAVTERSLKRNLGHSHLHCHLGTQMQAIRLALDTGDIARAQHHLQQAKALHAQAGADSLHGSELALCQVLVQQAAGEHAQALRDARAWLAAPQVRPAEDRASALIAAARAALAIGDAASARAHLAEAATLPALPLALHAHRLTAALRLARATGQGVDDAEQHARQWLAQPLLPVLEAKALRLALADLGR